MKYPIPIWLSPLNIFQIMGTSCCLNMRNNFESMNFSKHFFCYDARTIYEANMLVIWGIISPKLANLLPKYFCYLPKSRFILQIRPCLSEADTRLGLDTNLNLSCGELGQKGIRQAINEARQCLAA